MASASELYQQGLMTLAGQAVGAGTLSDPQGAVFLDNPLCGDRIEIQVRLEGSTVQAIGHRVKGCLLCQAAASAIGKHAPGTSCEDLARIAGQVSEMLKTQAPPPSGWQELQLFAPVHAHPSRYRCVQLPFEALLQALHAARNGSDGGGR